MKFHYSLACSLSLLVLLLVLPGRQAVQHQSHHRLLKTTDTYHGMHGAIGDYTIIKNLDSPGDDLAFFPNTPVDQLIAKCNADTQCLGFNTAGYLKKRIQAKLRWNPESFDFYLKTPPHDYIKASSVYVQGKISEGYDFHQGLDSGMNDIGFTGETSTNRLRTLCEQHPACRGFNTIGYLKYDIQAPNQWDWFSTDSDQGLFVRTERPDYTLFKGMDSLGGDFQSFPALSLVDLKAKCDAEPLCLGFNSGGFLKMKLSPRSVWHSDGLDLFVKNQWADEPKHGMGVVIGSARNWWFFKGYDSSSNDLRCDPKLSLADLQVQCSTNQQCIGFTILDNVACMKNAVKPYNEWDRVANNDHTHGFYTKIPEDYTLRTQTDSGGNDIDQYPGVAVDMLKVMCDAEPNCFGFNSLGFLKSKLQPSANSAGVDLYIKR